MLRLVVLAAVAALAAETAPPGGFWMKRYPLRRYGAFWHLRLSTKDFSKARAAVEKALAKHKGVSTVSEESRVGSDKVRYLQWSYSFSRAQAPQAVEELEKLGTVLRAEQAENFQPELDGEVPVKLEGLAGERASADAALARYPAIAAAVAEITAHLEAVTKAFKDSQDAVLLNLSLEEAPK